MSFGFLGIQFGFALQGAFMTRIFQTLGADKHEIPLLWIAAPLTGLLVQPIIGYMSDRTWHKRLGRRRPYFFPEGAEAERWPDMKRGSANAFPVATLADTLPEPNTEGAVDVGAN